jgi:hypothetical protein
MTKKSSRRKFIRQIGGSTLLFTTGPLRTLASDNVESYSHPYCKVISQNDRIRIATKGMGITGNVDTDSALKVPGVELVAACDLYYGRLTRVKEKYGKNVFTTRDYRELLNRKDIDTQKKAGKPMQVGSQRVSSIVYRKVKELYKSGEIGKLNCIEASFDRQDALGAWEYTMPTDGSPETVDWERYIEGMNKMSWDPVNMKVN